jgi:acetoin utilization protein AcuB
MRVHEVMTENARAVAPELPLSEAIGLMAEHGVRHLPVVDGGKLVGVISERDLLEATGWKTGRYLEADHAPKVVRDYMSVPVETVERDEDVRTAVDRILDRRVGCLPVVDAAGRLEGILTVEDLLAAELRACASTRGVAELDSVVASRMSAPPLTADVRTTVAEALEMCHGHGVRHLPVRSDGWFVGIVSDRDLRLRVGRGELERPLEEVMTTDFATVGPESLVSDAAELMQRRRVESVSVTNEGRLVGVLTTTDVLRLLHDRIAPVP